MSPWERLLEKPHARGHLVQLYSPRNKQFLVKNVSLYLSEGLRRGEGLLVIATPEHWEDFVRELQRLGADPESAIRNNRLVSLDAQETLSRFMVAGRPDWERFEATVSAAIRTVQPREGQTALRAYGEMVDLLWNARQLAAAIRLEHFWNRLLARCSFSLYCAYSIDVFGDKLRGAAMDDILSAHTHLMPGGPEGHLETAVNLAMDDILGVKADAFRALINEHHRPTRAVVPKAEAAILWLRRNLPEQAERIIARAQEYYRQLADGRTPAFASE